MIMDDKTQQMMQILAAQNVCDGILYEPRAYFDRFSTYVNGISQGDSNGTVFVNGEDYPLRITHLLAMNAFDVEDDERLVQRYGLRIKSHDTYYMTPIYTPLPLYHNERIAASDVVTKATSTWRFWRPFYMGARDTIQVQFKLVSAMAANDGTRRIGVTFNGIGALSRRPKQLTGYADVTDDNGILAVSIPPAFFKNDGVEPLEITEMAVSCGPASQGSNGNLRLVDINMRLVGNGTNASWMAGPDNSDDFIPASLLGLTTGRAITHRLPVGNDNHPGWLLYPGMGFTMEVQDFFQNEQTIFVAALGHLIVK